MSGPCVAIQAKTRFVSGEAKAPKISDFISPKREIAQAAMNTPIIDMTTP